MLSAREVKYFSCKEQATTKLPRKAPQPIKLLYKLQHKLSSSCKQLFHIKQHFPFSESQRKTKQPKLTAQKKAKGSKRQTSDGRRTTLCQVLHGHEELLPARMTTAPVWSVGDLLLPVFWCLWWHFTAVLLRSAPHGWGLQNVFHGCVVSAWGTPGDTNRN